MREREISFVYNKHNAIVFLLAIIIYTLLTFSPGVTLRYVGLDFAYSFVFISEFLVVTLFYLLSLRKLPGCKIRIKADADTIRLSSYLFIIIILIQFGVYCYRDHLYHYEPSQLNWIEIFVMTMVVPYYEEIIYRGCVFGFLCSIFRKNLIIPCVITSVLFCIMHGQYYDVLDQVILFILSLILLKVRIESNGLFYSMVIHSGMNAFVVFLNIQKIF